MFMKQFLHRGNWSFTDNYFGVNSSTQTFHLSIIECWNKWKSFNVVVYDRSCEHCVTPFCHHSHFCQTLPNVIVILYSHRVEAPQCSGVAYGFLNYLTFIPDYSVPNLTE